MKQYSVTLNWYGELHNFLVAAKNEKIALNSACHMLFNLLDLNYSYHRSKFNGQKDNFIVKEL